MKSVQIAGREYVYASKGLARTPVVIILLRIVIKVGKKMF